MNSSDVETVVQGNQSSREMSGVSGDIAIQASGSSVDLRIDGDSHISVDGGNNSVRISLMEDCSSPEDVPSVSLKLQAEYNSVYFHPRIEYTEEWGEDASSCSVKEIASPTVTFGEVSNGGETSPTAEELIGTTKQEEIKSIGWFGSDKIQYQKRTDSQYCKSCGSDSDAIINVVTERHLVLFGVSLRDSVVAEYEECNHCYQRDVESQLSELERKNIFD